MRRVLVLLGVLPLLLSGCSFLFPKGGASQPVEVEEKLLVEAPLTPATQPAALEVYQYTRDLPAGFVYFSGSGVKKLYAVPDHPGADDPNVVIGALGWRGGAYGKVPDEVRQRAAAWGGSALFCPPNAGFCYVLHEGAAATEQAFPGHLQLLEEERGKHAGFKPDSEPKAHSLQDARPFTFETTPSYCYVLVMALDPAARLEEAGFGLYGEAKSNDPLLLNRSLIATQKFTTPEGIEITTPVGGPYVNLRAFSQPLGCAMGENEVTVRLTAQARRPKLGTGRFWTQILAKKIPEAELKKRKADMDRSLAQARREAAAQRQRDEEARRQREAQREADRKAREAARRNPPAKKEPAGGGHYSLSLKNECRQTVRLFIGDKPKFGSGRYTTVSANSITSYSGFAPQTFWIVDQSDNGISSWTASSGSHSMQITSSCNGFARR